MVALLLGAVLGLERELVGKEAAGSPHDDARHRRRIDLCHDRARAPLHRLAHDRQSCRTHRAQQRLFGVIANIVVGIGFLGAGLIIKTNDHPHGVTTAALIWTAAAIGMLVGIGLTVRVCRGSGARSIALLLRTLNVSEGLGKRCILQIKISHSGKFLFT